jgi:hypothetical protein
MNTSTVKKSALNKNEAGELVQWLLFGLSVTRSV